MKPALILALILAGFVGAAVHDLTHNQAAAWTERACHTDTECAQLGGNGGPE